MLKFNRNLLLIDLACNHAHCNHLAVGTIELAPVPMLKKTLQTKPDFLIKTYPERYQRRSKGFCNLYMETTHIHYMIYKDILRVRVENMTKIRRYSAIWALIQFLFVE